MSLNSMTGFARVEGGNDNAHWVLEARSVNGKGLDVRVRYPSGFDAVDVAVRKSMSARLARGNVQVSINYEQATASEALQLNDALFGAALSIAKEKAAQHGLAAPTIDGLLRLKGVLEVADNAAIDQDLSALMLDVDRLCTALAEARKAEGASLLPVINGFIDHIESLSNAARATAESQPAQIKQKLLDRLADLGNDEFDQQRLAQEASLLASKADVREELDRLDAHVNAARELIGSDKPIGRKLDFLMQEFNREANTLCSKSSSTELTQIGLDLKTAIEQLREQIQNVE